MFPDRFIPVCSPMLLTAQPHMSPDQVLALPLLHYRWKSGATNAPSWERWQAHAGAKISQLHITQTFSEEVHALDAAITGQPGKTTNGLAQINAQYFDIHQNDPLSPPTLATVAAVWWEGSSSH
ncbi:hypothetical protein [Roseovarius ramblicola]|uniref:Uncharacterized protein n=1 Tax=Roseovarius ramblicola TaxID=2022336 RepID=A0ABV5HZH8_9RHOB